MRLKPTHERAFDAMAEALRWMAQQPHHHDLMNATLTDDGLRGFDIVKMLDDVGPFQQQFFAIAKPGEDVFLDCAQPLKAEQFDRIQSHLAPMIERTGVKVVILGAPLKVARIEVAR